MVKRITAYRFSKKFKKQYQAMPLEIKQAFNEKLALFLTVLDIGPIVRWGRPLGRLDSVRAERALRWFQEAPIGKLRQGFWGLKTLIFMGYYGRNEVWPELGYAPSIGGGNGADD